MNARAIWAQFIVHRKNSAQIYRMPECDWEEHAIARLIARCMDAHFDEAPMPFEGEKA